MQTVAQADVLADLAQRVRAHYGDRLVGLYALPNDPYEPERGSEEHGVHVVIVLRGGYDYSAETDNVTRIAHDVMDRTEWQYPVAPHHISADSRLIQHLNDAGVRLD